MSGKQSQCAVGNIAGGIVWCRASAGATVGNQGKRSIIQCHFFICTLHFHANEITLLQLQIVVIYFEPGGIYNPIPYFVILDEMLVYTFAVNP
jgi:hypothetical protein